MLLHLHLWHAAEKQFIGIAKTIFLEVDLAAVDDVSFALPLFAAGFEALEFEFILMPTTLSLRDWGFIIVLNEETMFRGWTSLKLGQKVGHHEDTFDAHSI